MGAPVEIKYNCNNCKMPNHVTYAQLPRINEHLIEKVLVHDNEWMSVRVWRCRCSECGYSTIFNETTSYKSQQYRISEVS